MSTLKIKSPEEIEYMRKAGQIVGSVLYDLAKNISIGMTPKELDQQARQLIVERGGELAFYKYHGFPAAICVSVNDCVVHGIPGETPFKDGDIVGIDVGAKVHGYYADAAITVGVGEISKTAHQLLEVTKAALDAGIARVVAGKHLGDAQAAIEQTVRAAGFGIIEDLVGHGIGTDLHEEPQIPNYGDAGTGPILQSGVTICLEPMVTAGSPEVFVDKDRWGIRTKDKSLGAQFEHTLLVTDAGAEILTLQAAWPKAV